MIQVSIAYATSEKQVWHDRSVALDATVREVIESSGILSEFPDIDLSKNKVGIFGHIVDADHTVEDGDRVEIYRAILIVPENLQRKKYKLRKLVPTIETVNRVRKMSDT